MHRLMAIPGRTLLAAVLAGVATLGSSFALAAVSGYLITRAWTMPPVLDLSVAVVAVRALGISRGVFRYLERLLTHNAALGGVVRLRTALYTALAERTDDELLRLSRGDLLSRMGDDADDQANHVIRAHIPMLVAIMMGVIVTLTFLPLSPFAAVIMLLSLVIATVAAPLAAYRAALITERALIEHRAALTTLTLDGLENADALRVAGTHPALLRDLTSAQAEFDRALDRAAAPAAVARAGVMLAMVPALIGSILGAGAVWLESGNGFLQGFAGHSAGIIGILLLLPLSSFEAATVLPAAAAQRARSRAAADRLGHLLGDGASEPVDSEQLPAADGPLTLVASNLTAGWSEPVVKDVNHTFTPGSRTLIYGRSGRGKSTLLLTLAGLIQPLRGRVALGHGEEWACLTALAESDLRSQLVCFTEDAHLFATTVRENIHVAKRDISDAEIEQVLEQARLGDWVRSLPNGLDTMIGSGGADVSGGERRRLLLARAIARQAPITILDEPTEHLDATTAEQLMDALLATGEGALLPHSTLIIVTHDRRFADRAATVLDLETTWLASPASTN